MASVPAWLPALFESENFKHYYAYFENYKHNHKTHSAVALARLGASKERVEKHCQTQNNRTNVIAYHEGEQSNQSIVDDSLKSSNVGDYLGKNVGYYTILDHFIKSYDTVYNKDIKKMISSELPRMIDGPLPGAFHGLIQLAYGFVANSDTVMIEGLAMIYHQYAPIYPDNPTKKRDLSNFGQGTTDILDVLKELRTNKDIIDHIYDKSHERKAHSPNNPYDWMVRGVLHHYTDKYVKLTDSIKLPDWFSKDKQDMTQIVKLIDWMLDMAVVVYVSTEWPNDFFLLHGFTSAWALKQIIHLVDFNTALVAIRAHLFSILAVYSSVKHPELNKSPDDYWKGEVNQAAWDKIIAEAIPVEWENHIFKVVQIMYEQWKAYPNSQYAKYYIAAARLALDNPLVVVPEAFARGIPDMTLPNKI